MNINNYLTPQNTIIAIALYGAILSTFNFIKDRTKEKLKLKVSAYRELLGVENIDVCVISILNQSFFKIEILSVRLAVFSDPDEKTSQVSISPNSDFQDRPKLPAEIEVKRLFRYPIEAEFINDRLFEMGLVGRIKLQPFAEINDQKFFGEPLYFNAVGKYS